MRIHLLKSSLSLLRWSLIALAGVAVGSVAAQTQGVTDTEILVGAVVDLSGPVANYGVSDREGLIFATEEINAAGGIHGRKIRVLVEDSGYDPKKGVLVTQKLLTQDKVFALMNTQGSATVLATQPLAMERGVPFLFPVSSSESTYLPLHPLKFALLPATSEHLRTSVEYAYAKLGKRRFGILYQDDETGQAALRAAEEQLKLHGLTMLERTSHKRGETNFSAQIARLKAANVDIVVLGTLIRETAAAEIEAKAQGWPVDMIVPWTFPLMITLAGQAAEGLYGATQFLGTAQPLTTAAYKALVERYKARFGHDIGDGTSFGYTSMMLFAEGARHAGRNLTGTTLSQGLEKIKNFKAVFEAPLISYTPTDHAPPRAAFIMQVRGGKWVQIAGPTTYDELMR